MTLIPSLEAYAAKLDAWVAEGAEGADVLVLPEYAPMEVAAAFTQGADAGAEREAVCAHAETLLAMMVAAARRHNVWLLGGSWPFRDARGVRNRAPLIAPDGRTRFQDKRNMTRFETEAWGIAAGEMPSVFATEWGEIGIAICYDVEFPLLVRAQVEAGAWLILVPACTDTRAGFNRVRLAARARALENQCFVAISPTVGSAPWLATLDENCGAAGVYGPVDRGFPEDGVITQGTPDQPGWVFATLNPADLAEVRAHGAVRNHRDWLGAVPHAPVQP